jgi:hypothetical protein
VFIAASGQMPGRLPELAIAVQIDTTPHRSEILISHAFQRFALSFNRTAVKLGIEELLGLAKALFGKDDGLRLACWISDTLRPI